MLTCEFVFGEAIRFPSKVKELPKNSTIFQKVEYFGRAYVATRAEFVKSALVGLVDLVNELAEALFYTIFSVKGNHWSNCGETLKFTAKSLVGVCAPSFAVQWFGTKEIEKTDDFGVADDHNNPLKTDDFGLADDHNNPLNTDDLGGSNGTVSSVSNLEFREGVSEK